MTKSKQKRKIVLIWPDGIDVTDNIPISLAYLIGNIDRNKYNFKVLDFSLHDKESLTQTLMAFNPQIAGISCVSSNFHRALSLLKLVKSVNPDITTIMGGPHVTCFPEKTMDNKEIDFVFRGEGEFGFPLFLDEYYKDRPDWSHIQGLLFRNSIDGHIIDNGIARVDSLDEIGMPDYDAIDLEGYFQKGYRYSSSTKRSAPIVATRGCPYTCTFCSAPLINGTTIRKHSISYLINLTTYLYHAKKINLIEIIDDNFTYDVEFAKLFCDEIIKLGLTNLEFETSNGIRMERGDKELWTLMKLAGWRFIIIAPESGSIKTLSRMKKRTNPDKVPSIVKDIKDAGLKVHGFFIVG